MRQLKCNQILGQNDDVQYFSNAALEKFYDFLKVEWGDEVAQDIWNLRLSEDINSQDFGWLYLKNRP